ncbi:MAG: molybdenum cofactor biosynthesis protein MoaA, partial [Thermosphaera sp.]
MPGLDPFKLTTIAEKQVTRLRNGVLERRYYRFRGGRWYGGIATGDVVGCNLRCKFCWSWRYSFYGNKG